MNPFDLTIDDIGAQGDGIAYKDGKTIFVTGALPNEIIKASPAKNSPHDRADILEILTPSPARAAPPCPHFPKCGGCRLQHMTLTAYTDWKIQTLKNTLGSAGIANIPLLPPVVTAPLTRRRARLGAQRTENGVILGFNEWRSHNLVNLTNCATLTSELTAFLQKLREKLRLWLPKGSTCDIQITSLDRGFDVVLVGGPPLGLDSRQSLALLAEELDIAQISWREWDRSPIEPIAHRRPLTKRFSETDIPFPPASFLQATQTGEDALIAFAINAIGNANKIMDLFCGLGGFGLSMPSAKHIHFADIDGPAVEALNRITRHNPRWRVDERNLIGQPYDESVLNDFDAIIFDPPRGGAKRLAQNLAQSKVPTLVAISCDPPAFARDAKILIEGGYKLKSLQPVDQFLWSTHLELAACFSKT